MKRHRLKNFVYLSVIVASLGLPILGFLCAGEAIASPQKPVVAITQIVPHPSLDLIRKGIEDELAEQKVDCTLVFENAHGKIDTATLIAQKFVSQSPDVIVPISTPSAQAVYSTARQSHIPVIFAAVNDPVSAKLVPSMDKAGNGITGVSDMPPIQEQVALIFEILPNVKKIGIIYNPGESNSDAVVCQFEKAVAKRGIKLIKATSVNMVDVQTAARSLVGAVDAIYIPNDNTIVAALDSLVKVAMDNKIPVFSADPESVKQGCLAAITHSQYGLGRQTGKMVARFLKGTDIQKMPVESPSVIELSVNQDTAKALKIVVSEAVVSRANFVIKK